MLVCLHNSLFTFYINWIYLIILILYFIRIVFNGVDLYEVRQVAFFLNFTWLFFLERHFKWRSGWNKEMFLLITFLVMVSNSLLFYSESISLFFVGIFSGLTDKPTVFYRSSDFVIYSVGFASLLLVLKHKYSTLAFFSVMGRSATLGILASWWIIFFLLEDAINSLNQTKCQ